MKTYVIHMSRAVERKNLVKQIVNLTNAEIFEGIVVPGNGKLAGEAGCFASHVGIYRNAPSNEDIMVFEDDCEIIDPYFLRFVNDNKLKYDVMYIGVNKTLYDDRNRIIGSWGTHAMWISSASRKLFLNCPRNELAFDNFWNLVETKYKLRVWRPDPIYRFVRQKEGLKSYITGKLRVNLK